MRKRNMRQEYNKFELIQIQIQITNYMFEEQKDQRQYLKNKIKQLEQQIVERARNYMQSSRSRVRNTLSLPSPNAPMVNRQIQTDQLALTNITDQTDTNQQSRGYQVAQFDQWLKQYLKSWGLLQNCINLNGDNDNNKQDSLPYPQAKINQILTKKRCIVLQTIDKIVTILSSKSQVQCLNPLILQLEQFKQVYLKSDQSLQQYLGEYCNVERQKRREGEKSNYETKIKQLEESLQQFKFQISNMQNRCNFIKKALNQSQQQNYQLRLKIQQNEIKLRNINQIMQKNKNQKQKQEQLCQQLKNKVQKLQTIKKQYLRAYTRVKQQKEQIQIKNMQLQQKMQKLKTTLANQRSIYSSNSAQLQMNINQIEQVQEQDMRLKTIIQHSQDQLIEEVLRHTSSSNSLNIIKQIIEHGLMETNRSTSQKWIKSALVKLDEFEQLREEEQQRMIQSQNNLQNQIHQKYRILITNLVKLISRDQYTMQHNFNRMMDKIIGQNKLRLLAGNQQKQNQNDNTQIILKKMKTDMQRSSSQQLSTSNIAQTQQTKKQTAVQILELISKLNQSQKRYKDLKRIYDELVLHQNFKSKYNLPKRMENDFEKFMNKIVQNYHLTQIKKNNKQSSRFTQSFFDKLSLRLFQILCNFPTGTHGQVFFIPANQQELEDAVEVLYKFSLEFDKFQESRLKQFKSEAKGLTKVLEQIALANEVPPEVVIQSMNNNLDADNTMSSPYVKSLIKKLSQQKTTKKQRQLPLNEKSKLEAQQLQILKQSI